MYLDDDAPIAGGREIWGFPKKLASPKIAHEGDVVVCTLHYGSVLCVSVTMGFKLRETDRAPLVKALARPNFMIKIIPHVACTPRICELVRYYMEDVTVKGGRAGPAAIELFEYAMCDVARLPVREAVSANPLHHRPHTRSRRGGVRLPERCVKGSLMPRFSEKVVIITGAASGIGKEIALRFAAEGGVPVIADLNLDAADATAREIKAKGSDAFAVAMNVADETAVEKGVADTMAKYGRIDVLVSNAAIQIVKPIVDLPFADWKRLLAIHLDGAFLTTRACLKHMYKAKSGSIVYMGSVHSKEASVLKAPYVTAKHGLAGLTKTVALELATFGVTANCISPGYVWTPLVEKQIPDTMKARNMTKEQVMNDVLLAAQPTKQFVTVDELAALAVFLASDSAKQITGANISMDGGWTAA